MTTLENVQLKRVCVGGEEVALLQQNQVANLLLKGGVLYCCSMAISSLKERTIKTSKNHNLVEFLPCYYELRRNNSLQ